MNPEGGAYCRDCGYWYSDADALVDGVCDVCCDNPEKYDQPDDEYHGDEDEPTPRCDDEPEPAIAF